MTMHRAGALLAALCLLLAACDDRSTVTVGSKNFGESNVLAHMFAILAEERGIDVAGPVEYPTTQSVLEALKRGDVDIYPDYNGTGLVMIGQNPMAEIKNESQQLNVRGSALVQLPQRGRGTAGLRGRGRGCLQLRHSLEVAARRCALLERGSSEDPFG